MNEFGVTQYELEPDKIRDIAPDVLDHNGRLRILPAAFWANTTPDERLLFGHNHAIYSFPTIELLEYLRDLIGTQKAIEIGAGNGVLARALGITATDSKMQNKARYRPIYELTGQPPVKYGRNVDELDARAAVRRFDPDVVLGCWVTHRYEASRHWAGGNVAGVDEADVLAHTRKYIAVGNEKVHAGKAIWELPHRKLHLPFLYSRAANGTPDFLAIWDGSK